MLQRLETSSIFHASKNFQKKFFLVVTNSPSSSSSTTNAPATTTLEISETATTLRIHNLVLLASQIVSAVRHLHKFGIIHKDIATR